MSSITVLKFGGSVLRSPADLPLLVSEVYRFVRAGERVVAVVSAVGDTTDRLLETARSLDARPHCSHLTALLETGESSAAALLALALERAGIPAARLGAREAGLRAEGPLADAALVALDAGAVLTALERSPAVVLPGFIGLAASGQTALLGRGGSDLTALFVAERLNAARCRLVKDVDGLFERDPNAPGPAPRRYASIPWTEALALGGGVVQPKAIAFARERGLAFEVAGLASAVPTRVGPGPAQLLEPEPPPRPLRVALLGLGTVGYGVWRALELRPEHFEVGAVLVRRRARPRDLGVPPSLLTTSAEEALSGEPDVVVELLGDAAAARRVVEGALAQGRNVVTASKAALADHLESWLALARANGAELRYCAAVGGALPALETARRLHAEGGIRGFEGVLNGTANFVLDAIAAGSELGAAIARAREAGLAEADPRVDLDGTDSARKVLLLAPAAFPGRGAPAWRSRRGILGLSPASLRGSGKAVKLVASCFDTPSGLVASLEPRFLEADHPLARPRAEENALVFHLQSGGEEELHGKGAGRWPTAESVLGDLLEIARERRASGTAVPAPLEAAS